MTEVNENPPTDVPTEAVQPATTPEPIDGGTPEPTTPVETSFPEDDNPENNVGDEVQDSEQDPASQTAGEQVE